MSSMTRLDWSYLSGVVNQLTLGQLVHLNTPVSNERICFEHSSFLLLAPATSRSVVREFQAQLPCLYTFCLTNSAFLSLRLCEP